MVMFATPCELHPLCVVACRPPVVAHPPGSPSIACRPNPTHPHLQYSSSSSSTAYSFSSYFFLLLPSPHLPPLLFPSKTVPWHMLANWMLAHAMNQTHTSPTIEQYGSSTLKFHNDKNDQYPLVQSVLFKDTKKHILLNWVLETLTSTKAHTV